MCKNGDNKLMTQKQKITKRWTSSTKPKATSLVYEIDKTFSNLGIKSRKNRKGANMLQKQGRGLNYRLRGN